jgi:Holliday junction resolvase-like predicted endonuclease
MSVWLLSLLKHLFFSNPANAAIVNTISTVIGAAALSEAAYFSLRGLILSQFRRGSFAFIGLASATFLFAMFWTSFYEYLIIERTLEQAEFGQLELQDNFPLIAEKLNAAAKTGNQDLIARAAYVVYGIRVAYHRKSGEGVYYVPPTDMRKLREETEQFTDALRKLRLVSKGLLYRAEDVVTVTFFSFAVCVCWTLIRRSSNDQFIADRANTLETSLRSSTHC